MSMVEIKFSLMSLGDRAHWEDERSPVAGHHSRGKDMTKNANSLTSAQHRDLSSMARNPDGYFGSCTNSTMNALKRRGLVELTWIEHESMNPFLRREKWVITDAGKQAIAR